MDTKIVRQYRMPFRESSVVGSHGLGNTIRIHWDIITLCNLNCSYCYARENEPWNKIQTLTQIDNILEMIRRDNINEYEVILLGGEPTMHPKYFYILDALDQLQNIVSVSTITNGQSKKLDTEWVEKHKIYSKFFLNVTFHPADSDLQSIKSLLSMWDNKRVILNIVLLGPKFNTGILDAINFCKENTITARCNIPFRPDNTDQYLKKTDDYKEWLNSIANEFERYLYFVYNNGTEEVLNDIDVYLRELNKFKGWKCKNNNWSVAVNSTELKRMCNGTTSDEYMTCTLDACTCQGLLSVDKQYSTS